MNSETQQPHVAIVPTPWMGHLIPLVQLANRLVRLTHFHFRVTIILPSDGSSLHHQKALLKSLPPSISSVILPPPSFDDLPEATKIETRTLVMVNRSFPALRDSLKLLSESTRLVSMVVDLFGLHASQVANEFGVPTYLYCTTNATCLSFLLHIPKLDQSFPGEYKDMPEPLTLPGCVPVPGSDFPDPFLDKQDEVYHRVVEICKLCHSVAGILINSFLELEPGVLKALNDREPLVYPVGPIVQTGSTGEDHDCLRWLDGQPEQSVVFVAFGSGWTLSQKQLIELALGLEMSEQRFLWVIRTPNEQDGVAKTDHNVEEDPCGFLPNGFLERTKGVGLVVPYWAPQVQVLSHGSTGGFVSHCGWNSTLESVVHGVPMVGWPLYAEQKMNAILLSQDLKVAISVTKNERRVVNRYEIAKRVKAVLQGEEGKLMRKKMRELQHGAAMATSEEGSSTRSLLQVAEIWKNHKK